MVKKKSAVFLDRDGIVIEPIVIKSKPFSIENCNDIILYGEVVEFVLKARKIDKEIIVITNQPEISRGGISLNNVLCIHEKISFLTGIRNFYFCPHDDVDKCTCRKPKAGMIYAAAQNLNIDLNSSYLIGDRWRDIEAGKISGCKTMWIDRKYDEKSPTEFDFQIRNLLEALEFIN